MPSLAFHSLNLLTSDAPVSVPHHGVPAAQQGGGEIEGEALGGVITGPGDVNVDIALVRWPDGSKEVKTTSVNQSPPQLSYTGGRATISLHSTPDGSFEWMFVRALSPGLRNPSQASAQDVGEDHLDWILGGSFRDLMLETGAVAFGSNAEVRGDTSKVRNRLVVAFEPGDHVVPLLAFAITRQLALYRGFDKARWTG